ncbi:MAG: hypothetical protein KZQ85_08775 [Candidatus Thiodiazotropha sp. (ex Myrtea sp. 'scaly one' KF741663)]|nr:hypothetical protein [Candidatus Thiodiazotropha sp. (ex Myrtea sp. 'scaly one' KF741663)]
MTGKKRGATDKNISPKFAKKALAALDVPLDNVGIRETRLLYRLHGVEKPPPPDDGDHKEIKEYDHYYIDLWHRNLHKTQDKELGELRQELNFRIWNDPDLTEEELSAELRTFYESRIPAPD